MLKIFLVKSLFLINLYAVVYENAEDLSTKRWMLVSPEYQGKISNVFDKTKKSRVIKLDGNGTKSIYQLHVPPSLENIQMDKRFFTWEMNYLEDFVILIVLDTLEGKRHLIYTPDGENSYLQYGLNRIKKGKWEKYSRNLEKDLQLYEKENRIINIQYFIIKGSGSVDNIHLKRLNQKIAPPIVKKIVEKSPKIPLLSYKNDILPVIYLKGKNPLVLKLGEEYVEEGANAKNRDGSEINISISSNIDILVGGEYTVIYIATNKLGNSSIDKRQVVIGDLVNPKSKIIYEKCEDSFDPLKVHNEKIKELELDKLYREKIMPKAFPKKIKELDLEEVQEENVMPQGLPAPLVSSGLK